MRLHLQRLCNIILTSGCDVSATLLQHVLPTGSHGNMDFNLTLKQPTLFWKPVVLTPHSQIDQKSPECFNPLTFGIKLFACLGCFY